jgi:hypothetical protein
MSYPESDDILARASYDDDATSLRSASDQGPNSDDERFTTDLRDSLDVKEYDASILREEEEREELLAKKSTFDGIRRVFKGSSNDGLLSFGDREARRQRRRKRRGSERGLKGESAEEGQLMFEMEEGFKDISSKSSSSTLNLDAQTWRKYENQVRYSHNIQYCPSSRL